MQSEVHKFGLFSLQNSPLIYYGEITTGCWNLYEIQLNGEALTLAGLKTKEESVWTKVFSPVYLSFYFSGLDLLEIGLAELMLNSPLECRHYWTLL